MVCYSMLAVHGTQGFPSEKSDKCVPLVEVLSIHFLNCPKWFGSTFFVQAVGKCIVLLVGESGKFSVCLRVLLQPLPMPSVLL